MAIRYHANCFLFYFFLGRDNSGHVTRTIVEDISREFERLFVDRSCSITTENLSDPYFGTKTLSFPYQSKGQMGSRHV